MSETIHNESTSKVIYNTPHGGFHKGDIRRISTDLAKRLTTPSPVAQNEKPQPAICTLIGPGHPYYKDVPGGSA